MVGTLRLGPLAVEVGALPLLLVNVGYARAGVMAPVGGPDQSTFAVGAMIGVHAIAFLVGDEGSPPAADLVVAFDWIVPSRSSHYWFVRLDAGVGRYPYSWAPAGPYLPTLELAFGAQLPVWP